MKNFHIRRAVFVSVAVITALSTVGCASVAVSNDAIQQNTAFALGLDIGAFTISGRVDSGLKTSYLVKTDAGKQYSCYVAGTISITGREVSDAVCNEVGKPATRKSKSGGTCNALLKAAGRC